MPLWVFVVACWSATYATKGGKDGARNDSEEEEVARQRRQHEPVLGLGHVVARVELARRNAALLDSSRVARLHASHRPAASLSLLGSRLARLHTSRGLAATASATQHGHSGQPALVCNGERPQTPPRSPRASSPRTRNSRRPLYRGGWSNNTSKAPTEIQYRFQAHRRTHRNVRRGSRKQSNLQATSPHQGASPTHTGMHPSRVAAAAQATAKAKQDMKQPQLQPSQPSRQEPQTGADKHQSTPKAKAAPATASHSAHSKHPGDHQSHTALARNSGKVNSNSEHSRRPRSHKHTRRRNNREPASSPTHKQQQPKHIHSQQRQLAPQPCHNATHGQSKQYRATNPS